MTTGAAQIYYQGKNEFRGTPEKITGTRPGSVFSTSQLHFFNTVVGPALRPLVQNGSRGFGAPL